MEGFSGELYAHLVNTYHEWQRDHYSSRSPGLHWVMNHEWFNEVRRMCDSAGRPLWEPAFMLGGIDMLLGLPVIITQDGGVPELTDEIPAVKFVRVEP